jgi:hypothetical protein
MELVSDQTFEKVTVQLDDRMYLRCRFVECDLMYGGGDFHLEDCSLDRCTLKPFGSAARTIALLPTFGWSYSPPHERLG